MGENEQAISKEKKTTVSLEPLLQKKSFGQILITFVCLTEWW